MPAAGLLTLRERGWTTLEVAPEVDLRAIVPLLRPEFSDRLPTIRVERVSPKTTNQARPGTMSAIYGLGSFPLHTERAHWRVPPRYLIFRSAGVITKCPTTMLDSYGLGFDKQLVRDLFQEFWLVHWEGDGFLTQVLRPLPTSSWWQIRYDRCCMTIDDEKRQNLVSRLEGLLDSIALEYHFWEPSTVLLIDNWRVLHGRGKATDEDVGRVLERIVVP
jgi:Taurine catabolism dioxygenase TauD, TfdA family